MHGYAGMKRSNTAEVGIHLRGRYAPTNPLIGGRRDARQIGLIRSKRHDDNYKYRHCAGAHLRRFLPAELSPRLRTECSVDGIYDADYTDG